MALSLVGRELTRMGRRRSAYALRVIIPAASLALLVFLELAFSAGAFFFGGGTQADFGAEAFGRVLTTASMLFQIGVVVLIAPILSAGLVAQEKQDRTLGLLILADLRGYDIIFSKWLSAFLHAQLLLLTTLPILAIAALFGGVAVPVITLQIFLMSIAAATVCAAGIFASTAYRRAGEAVVLTLVFILVYTTLARYAAYALASSLDWDIFGAAVGAENAYWRGPAGWLPPAALAGAVALALLLAAALMLPSRVFEAPPRLPRGRLRRRNAAATAAQVIEPQPARSPSARAPALAEETTPVAALVRHSSTGLATTVRPWPLKLVTSLVLALVSMMLCTLGTILVVALIAYDIASSMRSIRDQGLLDDLRVTPIDGRDLARGIAHAHVRRCRFYYPALVVNTGYGLSMMGFMFMPMVLDDRYFLALPGLGVAALIGLGVALLIVYVSLLLRMVVFAACYFARTTFTVAVQTILAVVLYVALQFVVMVASAIISSLTMVAGLGFRMMSGEFALPQAAMLMALHLGALFVALVFFRRLFQETFHEARLPEH